MLSFEEFEVELIKALNIRYPETKIFKRQVIRINEVKQGIEIQRKDGVSAVIYPDNLYRGYEESESLEFVMKAIDTAVEFESILAFKGILRNWDMVRPYLKPYIINLDMNREFLLENHCIYRERLNFAYGCYIDLPGTKTGDSGIVNVTRELLKYWGITEEEAFQIAESNVVYEFSPIRVTVLKLMGLKEIDEEIKEGDDMFVLTTPNRVRGASGIFDTDFIHQKAEELQTNFYILPSSIHDLVLLKEEATPTNDMLKMMVKKINTTHVLPEDYLADTVYYYDREKKKVEIVDWV